jgi:hypothetical protein
MAVTRKIQTARQMQLHRACCPVFVDSKYYHFLINKSLHLLLFLGPRGE